MAVFLQVLYPNNLSLCAVIVLIAPVSPFSSSESSGLPTVLLRCLSEMNSRPKNLSSFILFSFCIFTSCHYILVCELVSADGAGVGIR